MLAIVTDTAIPDEEVGALIRVERMGWERLQAAAGSRLRRVLLHQP